MIPFIKEFILDNWTGLFHEIRPDDVLIIKAGSRAIRKPELAAITCFGNKLTEGKEEPFAVIRFPRYPSNPHATRTIEKEASALAKANEKLASSPLSKTVPRLLFSEKIKEVLVIGISVLKGAEMSRTILSQYPGDTFAQNFNLAFGWALDLCQAWGSAPRIFEQADMDRHVTGLLSEYGRLFPGHLAKHQNYLGSLASASQALIGRPFRDMPQHMDFHCSNIFISGEKVTGVIDWEDFDGNGTPFFDLIHFIFTYFEGLFEYFLSAGHFEGICSLSESAQWHELIEGRIQVFCSSSGMDRDLMSVFTPAYLVKSFMLASSPEKLAEAAAVKYDNLISFRPANIRQLVMVMGLFYLGRFKSRAENDGNRAIADACAKKIGEWMGLYRAL